MGYCIVWSWCPGSPTTLPHGSQDSTQLHFVRSKSHLGRGGGQSWTTLPKNAISDKAKSQTNYGHVSNHRQGQIMGQFMGKQETVQGLVRDS